jgi:hypothetical protein
MFVKDFDLKENTVLNVLKYNFNKYSPARLQRHGFTRHFAYNIRYSVVPINFSLLSITLYPSVITTLVYNDTKYSVPFMTL